MRELAAARLEALAHPEHWRLAAQRLEMLDGRAQAGNRRSHDQQLRIGHRRREVGRHHHGIGQTITGEEPVVFTIEAQILGDVSLARP
jgi:hypothetical protein